MCAQLYSAIFVVNSSFIVVSHRNVNKHHSNSSQFPHLTCFGTAGCRSWRQKSWGYGYNDVTGDWFGCQPLQISVNILLASKHKMYWSLSNHNAREIPVKEEDLILKAHS